MPPDATAQAVERPATSPSGPPSARQSHRARRLLAAAALLLPLIGIATYLVMVFQPFADAAGGCGGG